MRIRMCGNRESRQCPLLTLNNYGGKTSDVIVDVNLPGKPLAASDDGRIALDPSKLQLQELSGNVHWRIDVKAGETKRLTYQYERYVRSQ